MKSYSIIYECIKNLKIQDQNVIVENNYNVYNNIQQFIEEKSI